MINEHFITRLLQRVELLDLIDKVVPLKKMGNVHKGLCPFHNEKTPSFTVYSQEQTYHCFGCGAHGDAISFMREYYKLEFQPAIERLAADYGLQLEYEEKSEIQHTDLYDLLSKVTEFYQQQLQYAQNAQNYLTKRGFNANSINNYAIGYAPQSALLHKFKSQQADLLNMGLIKDGEKGIYERFRHRIMFPIHDARGRVIAFGGRVLDDSKPKYLNSPETILFKKNEILYNLHRVKKLTNLTEIIIVEGYVDVVSLAQFGINNVVATLGTALSSHHVQNLFKLVPKIIFCFDGDAAGQQAAKRALEQILPFLFDGREVYFAFLPANLDPDDIVRTQGVAGFRQYLLEAKALSKFLLEQLESQTGRDTGSPSGRDTGSPSGRDTGFPSGRDTGSPSGRDTGSPSGRDTRPYVSTPEQLAKLKKYIENNIIPLLEKLPKNGTYYHVMYAELEKISKNFGLIGVEFKKSARLINRVVPTDKVQIHSLAIKAIRLLLHNPQLAQEIEQIQLPSNGQDEELDLLLAMIAFIDSHPQTEPLGLLLYCESLSMQYKQKLGQLADSTYLLSEAEMLAEFTEIMNTLHLKSNLLARKQTLLAKLQSDNNDAQAQKELILIYQDLANYKTK
jgi:DNA primase catalytic core